MIFLKIMLFYFAYRYNRYTLHNQIYQKNDAMQQVMNFMRAEGLDENDCKDFQRDPTIWVWEWNRFLVIIR